MGMNPIDFLKTAKFLNNQKDECHLRTSISRSYYAVHLHIRDFISKKFLAGRKFRKRPHDKVIACLSQCEVSEIKSIAVMLGDLRQARTDADYKMDRTIKPIKSQDIYDDASELLSDFNAKVDINTNIQKLAKSSRVQARNEGLLPKQ